MVLNLFLPLARFTFVQHHPLESGLLIAAFTLIITWPLAHYSEKFIEQPAINLGKTLSEYIIFVLTPYFRTSLETEKSIV